ncbi:ABC transporter permease, partial [Paenibacillus sp. MCAF20]
MGNKSGVWAKVWPPVIVIAVLLACWQAVTMWGQVDQWLLPSPLSIVQEAASANVWPRLAEH